MALCAVPNSWSHLMGSLGGRVVKTSPLLSKHFGAGAVAFFSQRLALDWWHALGSKSNDQLLLVVLWGLCFLAIFCCVLVIGLVKSVIVLTRFCDIKTFVPIQRKGKMCFSSKKISMESCKNWPMEFGLSVWD